ncbi:MAG: hypothetical protein WAM62_06370 [Pseudolabrys sp.]
MAIGNYEQFAPHLNETFQVAVGESCVEMTLMQATKGKPRDWEGLRKEPFYLLFKCGKPVILPQKIYPFENSALGKLEIFIVPVARDKDGIVYQAVFN